MNDLRLARCIVIGCVFSILLPFQVARAATLEKQDLSYCHRDGKKVTLCFDLRDDSKPSA
jgi:hypothetical protein